MIEIGSLSPRFIEGGQQTIHTVNIGDADVPRVTGLVLLKLVGSQTLSIGGEAPAYPPEP